MQGILVEAKRGSADCAHCILDANFKYSHGVQAVSHESLLSLWAGYADPAAWLVLLWSALGPGALAAYLQTMVRVCLDFGLSHMRWSSGV